MNHFINIKDIPIAKLKKIISDARKRKSNRKTLNIFRAIIGGLNDFNEIKALDANGINSIHPIIDQ